MTDNSLIADGQFDDAIEDGQQPTSTSDSAQPADLRAAHHYIDDEEGLLEWSSSSSEDEFDADEDEAEAAAFDGLRAEDEDWEIAERGTV